MHRNPADILPDRPAEPPSRTTPDAIPCKGSLCAAPRLGAERYPGVRNSATNAGACRSQLLPPPGVSRPGQSAFSPFQAVPIGVGGLGKAWLAACRT